MKKIVFTLLLITATVVAMAQDSIAAFHPDSIFTLTEEDMEQERL